VQAYPKDLDPIDYFDHHTHHHPTQQQQREEEEDTKDSCMGQQAEAHKEDTLAAVADTAAAVAYATQAQQTAEAVVSAVATPPSLTPLLSFLQP
jgi:hypothetical protein